MTEAAQKQQFLACLSDPSRFSLVTTLAGGPRCVTELATLVGLSQSCTTRHLQALLREGIVSGERQGKRVMYALCASGPDAHPVLHWACGPIATSRHTTSAQASSVHAAAGGAGSRADGSEDRGLRRTRQRGDSMRRRPTGPEELIEVTDTLIVAHDSGWQNADETPEALDPISLGGAAANLSPPENQDTTHSARPETVRAVRADLDDFLL